VTLLPTCKAWHMDFSPTKSEVLIFSAKRLSARKRRRLPSPLKIGGKAVPFCTQYKYLGVTFQANGRWHAHFNATVSKARISALTIARINHYNRPPRPHTTIRLVKSILIPKISYGLAFVRFNRSQISKLNQIMAMPLRRAMGLPRTASAVGAMWHCDVPSLSTTKLTVMLQCISRAHVSASKGNALPQLLVDDLRAPVTKGPHYCRPFLNELNEVKAKHPDVAFSFPMSKAVIKSISQKALKSDWVAQSTVKHRRVKPSMGVSAFFKREAKPTLCIRSRICFSVALTPQRHHLYKHTPTPLCSACGVVGDLDHVLLHCT
jgi:hypothetical protein